MKYPAMFMYLICLAVLPIAASAQQKSCSQPRLVEFDAPLASLANGGTTPTVINDLGEVTGYYQDANAVYHAFVRYPDGRITSFDAPNVLTGVPNQGTVAYGLNDFGLTAGRFSDQQSINHGFVRNPDGHITTFDAPGADITDSFLGTTADSVNLLGAIAGGYFDANGNQHGFVRSPRGVFTEFDPPGSFYTTVAGFTGINPAGAIIGSYFGVLSGGDYNFHGYVRRPDGTITGFDPDYTGDYGSSGAGYGTYPSSINFWGAITGFYGDANAILHAFVRNPDGHITTFDAPGANTIPGYFVGTGAGAINALGVIVGQFFDAKFVSHGFIRSPGGTFTIIDAPGATTTTGSFHGTWAGGVNLQGVVTGFYQDANGGSHGYVWTPCDK